LDSELYKSEIDLEWQQLEKLYQECALFEGITE